MRTGSEARRRGRQHGYTYLLVLFLVAGLGVLAAEAGVVWQAATQREREAELLAVGSEMARALARYRDETPAGAAPWPTGLEQLLEDRRFPTLKRHLRRIYRDPLTGGAEWGLERQGEAILGIYSLSTQTPIRRKALPPELGEAAESAASYRDWVFRPALVGDAAGEGATGEGATGGARGESMGMGE